MATLTLRSQKGSPLTNQEVDDNFSNLNSSKLEVSGGTLTGPLSVTILTSSNVNGDEGGKLLLAKPATNTTIDTSVTVKLYQNKLQIFETGGLYRGAHLDITTSAADIGSKILTSSNINSYAPTLTGVGASGTWSINISGNSATVTSITSSQVTSALGYTPYNNSNPSGYITGYTETDTLATVTARGATTSTAVTLSADSNRVGNLYVGYGTYKNSITPVGDSNMNLDTPSGAVYVTTSIRSPIFYDRDDTGYYGDFNNGGIKAWRNSGYSGGISVADTGGYLTYRITTNNHSDGWGWQFTTNDITSGSGTKSFWVTYSGSNAYAAGSMRAPIFYDSDDTNYYVDPNSTSITNVLRANSILSPNAQTVVAADSAMPNTGGSFIHTLALGPGNNDGHIMGMTWASTTSVYGAQLWLDTDPTNLMALRSRSSVGTWNAWSYVITDWSNDQTKSGYFQSNSSLRAPIFYDSNDTGYYLDPNSTSNSALRIRGGALYGPNPTWGAYLLVGGDGRQGYIDNGSTASVCTTNGNLHIDSASGYNSYINWYDGTDFLVGAGDSSSERLRVYGSSNYTQATGSLRSPIFYDSDDTGYYLNPNGTSNLNTLLVSGRYVKLKSGDIGTGIYNTGWYTIASYGSGRCEDTLVISDADSGRHNFVKVNIVWSYGNGGVTVVQSGRHGASTIRHIRLMSNTSDQTYGGVLVQVYCENPSWTLYVHSEGQGSPGWGTLSIYGTAVQQDSPSGWAQYSRIDGINDQARLATTGYITSQNEVYAYGSLRSPIFYDNDDTGYYVNPNSNSNFAGDVNASQFYVGGWFRNNGSNTGLYNQSTTQHLSSSTNGYWDMSSTTSISGIRFYTGGHVSSLRGYVYADSSNNIGFLNSGGSWRARVVGDDYWLVDGSSARAQLYYDSNDTGYYWDGASTSKWNESNQNGWHTFNSYGLGITGTYDSYRLQTVFAMGSAYRMSSDGTSASNMYGIAWSHPNAGSVGGANNLNDHGILIINNGSFRAALSSRAVFSADVRGTLFYDYNDTGYYVNPNGDSYLSAVYANNWFRPQGDTGVYFQSYARGLYAADSGSNSYGNVTTYGSGKNGWQGWGIGSRHCFMSTGGDNVGVHDNSRGWIWYWDGSYMQLPYGYTYMAGSSRSPIFYDSDNTGYYCDPNGNTNVAGSITAGGNITAYSDKKLKANIVTITNALNLVKNLRGVIFTRTDLPDKEKQHIGVIAQEIEQYLPQVVENTGANKSVAYGNITALLIEAVKEQQQQIEQQQQQINNLTELVKSLANKSL